MVPERDTCAASHGPRTRNRGQMHQYNVGAPFERIAIDVAGSFPRSGYFTKLPEAHAIPYQEASTVAVSEYRWSLIMTKAITSNLVWYRRLTSDWARRAPHPCSRNRMAWSSATSKRSKSTYEKPSHRTRRIGTQDYPLLVAYRASIHDAAGLTPAILVFEKELRRPYDLPFGAPLQGTIHNRSRGRFSGQSTRHPQLCPPTSEACLWPDENSLRQTGHLLGLSWGRQMCLYRPTRT
jgi:hypothetical protein